MQCPTMPALLVPELLGNINLVYVYLKEGKQIGALKESSLLRLLVSVIEKKKNLDIDINYDFNIDDVILLMISILIMISILMI